MMNLRVAQVEILFGELEYIYKKLVSLQFMDYKEPG